MVVLTIQVFTDPILLLCKFIDIAVYSALVQTHKYWRFVTQRIIGHSPILDTVYFGIVPRLSLLFMHCLLLVIEDQSSSFSTVPAPPIVRPCKPKSHKMKVVSCNNPGNCLHSKLQVVIRVNSHEKQWVLQTYVTCVFICKALDQFKSGTQKAPLHISMISYVHHCCEPLENHSCITINKGVSLQKKNNLWWGLPASEQKKTLACAAEVLQLFLLLNLSPELAFILTI